MNTHSVLTVSQFVPPFEFGRYNLIELLGEGGMGRVFRAQDATLRREVALKVPLEQGCSNLGREALFNEARVASGLDHPNICPVHDADEFDGIVFMTMKLVRGVSLDKYRPPGCNMFDAPEAADLVRTLALALQYAHEQTIVHRDLKPENVMLQMGPPPTPIIMDLGLALRAGASIAGHRIGPREGTLSYMAPEQIDPNRLGKGSIDFRADIYALGGIFYYLLTGRRPFHDVADPRALLVRVLNDPPATPSTLRDGLPPQYDMLCLAMLAKAPDDRPESMARVAEALATLIADGSLGLIASTPCVPPLLGRDQFRFGFAPVGHDASTTYLERQNRLLLDVGNALKPGVIDHHHLPNMSISSARQVRHHTDLLRACVDPGNPTGPFTIVTHQSPDLDSVTSAFLAIEYLTTGRFPEGADILTMYLDQVDRGEIAVTLRHPFSLYAAYRWIVERALDREQDTEGAWQRCMEEGLRLVAFALVQALQKRCSLTELDCFDCPELFNDEDRRKVRGDRERYQKKLDDPKTKARIASVTAPGTLGGCMTFDALLVRHVQDDDDPDRCLFFKNWARTDTRNSPGGRGFAALCVAMVSKGNWRHTIISLTPDCGGTLSGLGERLEEAEATRRRALNGGRDDREFDPILGTKLPDRPGYNNPDPWYDGRGHGYTLIDAPKSGTRLSEDEIEEIFLKYAQAEKVRPLRP